MITLAVQHYPSLSDALVDNGKKCAAHEGEQIESKEMPFLPIFFTKK